MRMIIATHNYKKLAELPRILKPLGVDAVTDAEAGLKLDEVEETGSTFEENAFLKADAACRQPGLPAVADDSGLMPGPDRLCPGGGKRLRLRSAVRGGRRHVLRGTVRRGKGCDQPPWECSAGVFRKIGKVFAFALG